MVSKEVRQVRCEDVLTSFCEKGGAIFFTLTTPDVVDLYQIRERWRNLRHYLVENVFPRGTKYVMNYEIHPHGHGWHIHSVWSHYIPLKSVLSKIQSFGFGRVDVRRVTTKGVADYLTKHALKAYRGVCKKDGVSVRMRLVNTSRGLPRLSDYSYCSSFRSGVLELFNTVRTHNLISAYQKMPFNRLYSFAEISYLSGVRSLHDFWRWYRSFRMGNFTFGYSMAPSFCQDDFFLSDKCSTWNTKHLRLGSKCDTLFIS